MLYSPSPVMRRPEVPLTPRASPRNLFDEDSETLAVVRNDTLTRVGSVASVVATTSSIAIQSVVIPESTHSRQWFAQNIFFESRRKIFRDAGRSRPHRPVDHDAYLSKDCDDRHHASRPRSRRIRQRGVDEALRRRLQTSWNRCHRGRPAERKSGACGSRSSSRPRVEGMR